MRIKTLVGIAALTSLGLAHADVVSLNFHEYDGSKVTGSFGVTNVSGWVNTKLTSGSGLTTDKGAATTIGYTATQPAGQATFNAVYTGTALHGGLDVYSVPAVVGLDNLQANMEGSSVDLIVYLTGFNANTGASISDGTTTYYFQTANPADPTLVQTTDVDSGDGYDVANYAIFSGVTADSITLTLTTESGGGSGFGGVQVVGVIPEPATFGLIGVFGGAIFFIRRRLMV